MKKKLLISFSGGRTSAYMMWWILFVWNDRNKWDIVVVFANTGKEDEGTLEFVNRCSIEWGIKIIWIEAKHLDEKGNKLSKKGWKVSHKIVNFETASRNGEPFEEMISVLGIPSSQAPFCSDQLKRKSIESYLKSIGWNKGSFYKAIGIRSDEIDRINSDWRKNKIIYFLVTHHPTIKKQILTWFKEYNNFDLNVPEGLGNCDNCYKKSFKVLVNNAKKYPESFDWWNNMIIKYGNNRVNGDVSFFRGNKSVADIFKMVELSNLQLDLFQNQYKLDDCSNSCEPFK